jgi:phosphopantetheinyl transferase (holo-ACP synthase)
VGIDVEEISESIFDIADEFSTNEEVERVSKCAGPNRLLILVSIWAVKEAARKAIGPENCSMKELVVLEARKEGEYIVSEISHPIAGHLRSVTFQNNNYVYAISLSCESAIECHRECGGSRCAR